MTVHEIFINESGNLPTIKVRLDKGHNIALIDTGASINVIEEKFIPEGGNKNKCNITIKTISNKLIQIQEQVCS